MYIIHYLIIKEKPQTIPTLSFSPTPHAYIIRESSDRVPSSPLQISRSPYRNPLLSVISNQPPRTFIDFPQHHLHPTSTNSRMCWASDFLFQERGFVFWGILL
ncbi:unnamed protein product [Lactuca virosa]|uniref:Uncharacterized protein n=1 Tax=Lactuca virosa TaxID=75947 RepID=A0AAU9PKG6_9ASTR|nr:unnamed protein product [Lactuca virosa]